MTPEEHRDAAQQSFRNCRDVREVDIAIYHATMAVAEALLQIETCGHGTRGFCKDCVRNAFFSFPISVRDVGKQ